MPFLKHKNKLICKSLLVIFLLALKTTAFAQNDNHHISTTSNQQLSEAISLLSDYINIPTITGHENLATDFLKNLYLQKGLKVETISNLTGSLNLAASIYPLSRKKPNIIFLNHIDVVPAKDSIEWKFNPFKATLENDKLYGRGSFDNKGLAITQLLAIEKYIQKAKISELPYNITILSVSGEEFGGITGSAIVSINFGEKFTPAVVIGEGGSGIEYISILATDKPYFGISVAEKGLLWLKLDCEVISEGHSSVSGEDYAIKRLVKGLYKISRKKMHLQITEPAKLMFKNVGDNIGGMKGFALKHINWLIFRPFINHEINNNPEIASIFCTKITISNLHDDGNSPNQISQKAYALLDCRYLLNSTPEKLISSAKKIVKDSVIHVSILQQGAQPLFTQPEYFYDELANAIQRTFIGSEVSPILFPASSDNSYYRTAGIPVYGINPMIVSAAQMQSIHNKNEFIDLDDLVNGIKVFEDFLQAVLFPAKVTDSIQVKQSR